MAITAAALPQSGGHGAVPVAENLCLTPKYAAVRESESAHWRCCGLLKSQNPHPVTVTYLQKGHTTNPQIYQLVGLFSFMPPQGTVSGRGLELQIRKPQKLLKHRHSFEYWGVKYQTVRLNEIQLVENCRSQVMKRNKDGSWTTCVSTCLYHM